MKFAFKPVLMAALLAAGVVSGSHAVAADDGWHGSKASDRYPHLACSATRPPFGYIDSEGKSQGFDVEIAKDFAKDLLGSPDKVEYVITEAANRVDVPEIRQGGHHSGQLHADEGTCPRGGFRRALHEGVAGCGLSHQGAHQVRG